MKILLINWRSGENDPFSFFNQLLKEAFEKVGRPTAILNLEDINFKSKLSNYKQEGISFAFAWQGLGSRIQLSDDSAHTIWDELQIPLLCHHGDHPCHMPLNHKAISKYIVHNYFAPSFAKFANTYIKRNIAATFTQGPILFKNEVAGNVIGDYFVLPKNYDDIELTLNSWKEIPCKSLSAVLFNGFELICNELKKTQQVDHHDLIDDILTDTILEAICTELKIYSPLSVKFHVHALLDKIYRNKLSEHILLELHDVPIKVYGRGWDRFKNKSNKNHEFLNFDKLGDNAFQFSSNFGILDVSPTADNLHDRTGRAIANNSSFLSGSAWDACGQLGEEYSQLFFSAKSGQLRQLAENVMLHPNLHREVSHSFATKYKSTFSLYNYLKFVESTGEKINFHLNSN